MPLVPAEGGSQALAAAFRNESRLRAIYAILLTATLSSLWFSACFPQFADSILHLGAPVGHIVGAALIFGGLYALLATAGTIHFRWKIASAPLRRLRSRPIVRQTRAFAAALGLRVLPMASGDRSDGRMSAFSIARHDIIRVGTGALPLAIRQPEAFNFRLAHEIAHLLAGDPKRERSVLTAYAAAALMLIASLASVGVAISSSIATIAPFGWQAVASLWMSTLGFIAFANIASFVPFALSIAAEHMSATRLREFHADAVAAGLTGTPATAFGNRAAIAAHTVATGWLTALLRSHPDVDARLAAIDEAAAVFRADRILFLLQGYFAGLLLDLVLQLLFVNASQTSVSLGAKRTHLAELFSRDPWSVSLVIAGAFVLIVAANGIMLMRFLLSRPSDRGDRRSLLSVPILLIVGASFAVVTSQTVLWELKQAGWNPLPFASANLDRIALHLAAQLACAAALFVATRIGGHRQLIVAAALGSFPPLCALIVGSVLYG